MKELKRGKIKALIRTLKSKDYTVYEKPYQMNIVGIRKDSTKPNSFDDKIIMFWKDDKKNWEGYEAPATTDAGTYWLDNATKSKGTALLKEGQYKDTYKLDKHNGKYLALTQRLKNVTVIRDYNRDNVLDFKNGKPDTGMFGINIHRADSDGTTKYVGKYSAGCQVFANADDFDKMIEWAKRHEKLYGNVFTYTLIDERAYNRKIRRRIIYGVTIGISVVGIGVATYFLIKKFRK
jgi:hypothetical protein